LFDELIPSVEIGQFGMMNIKRAPTMNGRRGWNVPHGKRLTGEKGTIGKTGIEYLRLAASDSLSALEITVASRFAGGVLISSINIGRKAGQKTVACQSIKRSASKRVLTSAGESRSCSPFCAR
jgi:hypothetical protein